MIVTLVATLLVPLQYAILLGMGLSIVLHVFHQSNQVHVTQWVLQPGGFPLEQPVPKRLPSQQLTLLHVYGSLFFAAAKNLEEMLPEVGDATRAVAAINLRGKAKIGSTFVTVLQRYAAALHAPTCGYGPALEHNDDLYSCDHFVEPRFKLGNIHQTHMRDLVASPEQRKFGLDQRNTLTAQCQGCKVRHLCNGGCPKDRFALSRDGEPGQNYLCPGLELFFMHTGPLFAKMAHLFQQNRAPSEVMAWVAADDEKQGPYRPCPCGSGEKFRFCHGKKRG